MSKRVIGVCAVLCLLVAALPLQAAEEDHAQLAEQLMSTMKVDEQMRQSFEQMKQMQMQQFQSMSELTEEEIALQDRIFALVEKELSWDNVKGDIIGAYAEVFTKEEIQGLIDFFKSAIGQVFIEKMPEVSMKLMPIMQQRNMELMPKIQQLVEESNLGEEPVAPPMELPAE